MNVHSLHGFLVILFLSQLSGCSQPSVVPMPTLTNTTLPTPALSLTPTITQTPKPTSTHTPTNTVRPSRTPIPPTGSTQTITPTSSLLAAGVWPCPDSTEGALFVGSDKSNKFHRPNCEWALKIKPDNRLCFISKAAALSFGYLPCGVCKP